MRAILQALTAHTADLPRHLVAQTADAPPGGGLINMLMMFGLMFAVIYFMMIRPQQKTQKKHKDFLAGLKKGDEVVTQSGIFGKVHAVGDGDVTIEIARDVRVRMLKSQVAGLQKTDAPADKPAEQPAEKK